VILVSELMLQQTQVARVVDRLPRFLDRFPTPTVCADGAVGEVIDEWSGLGYNRRAVNLHRSAVVVRDRHDGAVPGSLPELLALPGIGPYTARAVRAFAFELDDGVVDTNIGRVLARIGGTALTPAAAQRLADELVPVGQGWPWNQAIMELGALLCRPTPNCASCPVQVGCAWRGSGPDPASGSAAVSKGQSRFAGSDRQGRGKLVNALRSGPVAVADLAAVMGWPEDRQRAERVAADVVADGLASRVDDHLCLP
jgi:A/G-specific adenine glycosylase